MIPHFFLHLLELAFNVYLMFFSLWNLSDPFEWNLSDKWNTSFNCSIWGEFEWRNENHLLAYFFYLLHLNENWVKSEDMEQRLHLPPLASFGICEDGFHLNFNLSCEEKKREAKMIPPDVPEICNANFIHVKITWQEK